MDQHYFKDTSTRVNSQNGDSSDNDYKGGKFDLEKNPKFAARPWVLSKNNATKNKYRHEVPKRVITIYSSSGGEDKYKEDPVEVWVLQQQQAGNKDPKFLSFSITENRSMMNNWLWPLDGAGHRPESSSWPPAQPGEKSPTIPGVKTPAM